MPAKTESAAITKLLLRLSSGERHVEGELLELVHKDLRRLAKRRLQLERADHTLQATALVNETYLRIFQNGDLKLENRAHFFAVAAKAMRRVLVDYARGVNAKKRSGIKIPLESALVFAPEQSGEVLALDEALERLTALDPRQAQVVELRFFTGLPLEKISAMLNISVRTAKRDWQMARAWLYGELAKS